MLISTCQVCGREIKTVRGRGTSIPATIGQMTVISHHGYQRPSRTGWQTASCPAARWRPYEVACDALPPAIEAAEDYVKHNKAQLKNWKANPPRGIERHPKSYFDKLQAHTVLRPKNFDSADVKPDYRFGSYVSLYLSKQAKLESNIVWGSREVTRLQKRLTEWKGKGKKK